MMEASRSEQEDEDVTTEYMLRMITDLPLENVELISQTLERCRSRLDGWSGAGRLLGPETLCPRCSTPWLCGQYRAELQPRPAATKPLRRLLNKRREGRPMGRLQTRLLDRFQAARDLIVLECKRCNNVTKLPIISRSGRGKSDPEPTQVTAQVTPGVTTQVTPGVTPAASGRRRSRARDKSAGLVIPASLRTPRTPAAASPVAAAAAETPAAGQSPLVKARPSAARTPSGVLPATDAGSPGEASPAPIALKKTRARPPTSGSSVAVGNTPVVATPAPIPLKKSRPSATMARPARGSGRGRGRGGAAPSPVTPVTSVTPSSAASGRERQRRLQKILAQADCRTSNTGLMAFLSEL